MSTYRRLRRPLLAVPLFLGLAFATAVQAQQITKNVIISTPQPYANVVSAIQQLGGTVKKQYKYVDAVAATVPSSALPALVNLVGDDAVSEDSILTPPRPVHLGRASVLPSQMTTYASAAVGAGTLIFNSSAGLPKTAPPNSSYAVNLNNLNVQQLQAAGITGKGITIAVIDSGVRPGYFALDSDGSVIGGENFVPDGNPLPDGNFSSPTNDPHGTFVATLISGNASFVVPSSSATFISAMNADFPGTLQLVQGSLNLPVIGSAPESSIYAVRVFGPNALEGTSTSVIMSAIESVISLRQMYNQGISGGVDIQICNLSFGTSTTFAGHTPLEQLVDQLFANDIVPVIAAGDAGPSSLTIASPATAFSSLTIGGTNPAPNDRLFRDLTGNPTGTPGTDNGLARASSATQTAYFSSRGPTADGRIFPDVVAAGVGVLSQGCGGVDPTTGMCLGNPNNVDVSNGTSFSAPIVAGIAALLRQKYPKASAGQIWNAIVNGANDSELGDDSTVLDQGQGVVDASAASKLIQTNKVSDQLPSPPKPNSNVPVNIQRNTDLNVSHGTVKQTFKNLKPGERGEIDYEIQDHTTELTVDLSNINPTLPPSQQNPFFGDDIFLNIHSAKTSAGSFGDYFEIAPPFTNAFVPSDGTSFTIPYPEPGVVRITLLGDYTNAGTISADVMVTVTKNPLPKVSVSDTIRGGDNLVYSFTMPSGVQKAEFLLRWSADWDNYPTNDLDMYLLDPLGNVNMDGATLNSPEHATVINPTAGTWVVLVQGFSVPTGKDRFELSVILDGKVVKLK